MKNKENRTRDRFKANNEEHQELNPLEPENNPEPGVADTPIDGANPDFIEEISVAEMFERLNQEIQETRTKAENYYRQKLQLEADFDRYRSRMREEKKETQDLATERIITALLPVLDNLERGLEAALKSQDFTGLHSGLQLVHRGFKDILDREGLQGIPALDCEFDPNFHEALFKVPVEGDQKDNIIVQELQPGYCLRGKVIRPARVAVAATGGDESEDIDINKDQ